MGNGTYEALKGAKNFGPEGVEPEGFGPEGFGENSLLQDAAQTLLAQAGYAGGQGTAHGQAGVQQEGPMGAQAGHKASCYELTIPTGMSLNEAQQAIFEEQARELGLSNVSAQKLLEISHRNALAHRAAHKKQVAAWGDEVRQDREMGGPAVESTLAYAKAGLARFDPEHKVFGLLQETGYANNPHVIRFLAAIGKAHGEDAVLFGQGAPMGTPRHERLYGKYNK